MSPYSAAMSPYNAMARPLLDREAAEGRHGNATMQGPSPVVEVVGRDLSKREWTCIATNNPYDLKIKEETLKELARHAKVVVIRSVTKINKCVVSKEKNKDGGDGDPIVRLRYGRDLSQSNMDGDRLGGDCPMFYIRDTWEGINPELERLWVRWGDDRGNPWGFHRLYWASCNDKGLHFLPGKESGWLPDRPADIEILIDASVETLQNASQEEKNQLRSMNLSRQVLSTIGLWDVLTWDADQTEAFIRSLFGGGPWQSLREAFRKAYKDEATAKFILLHTTSVKSMLNAMVTSSVLEQEMTQPRSPIEVPLFGLEATKMWTNLRLLLLVEGYRLQGDDFKDKVTKAVRQRKVRIRSPAWKGEVITDIRRDGERIPPGKLNQIRLDDSQGQSWEITAVIKTKPEPGRTQTSADDIYTGYRDGTIFARSFKTGKFGYIENDPGQAKILYLEGGCLKFAIASADDNSVLVSDRPLNDNEEHQVGVKLEEGAYSLIIDNEVVQELTPADQRLLVVPDSVRHTSFCVAVSVNDFQKLEDHLEKLQKGRRKAAPDCGITRGYVGGLEEPWFWQPRDKYVVGAKMVITDIEEVDAVKENFRAKFTLEFSWHHDAMCDWSKADHEVDYGTTDDGKPLDFDTACEQEEPQPYFVNAVEDPTCTAIVRRRDVARGAVVSTFYYFGTFYDAVEVHNFPFDDQDFFIKIHLKGKSTSPKRQLVPVSVDEEEIATYPGGGELENPEWVIRKPMPSFENDGMFQVEIRMQRKPDYYLVNVVLPLFLMITLSFCAFAVDADSFSDRFSVLGGVLLSTVAFRFTYADAMPKVSYQTWLDSYVLFANLFLIGLTFLVCYMSIREGTSEAVSWSWAPEWMTADHATAFFALALWVAMQQGVVIRTAAAYYEGYAFEWLHLPAIPSRYELELMIKERFKRKSA